ncbi:uncharacterized protein LOC117331579 [Pecten maximus]|uniref:uncharacterized protein LOC117331579 n=1 Tax=Pecten maximus TaxID=6579 RepID=UPI001458825D|nr:uncharacterized protein LOC117331579 [Pecten maximus]
MLRQRALRDVRIEFKNIIDKEAKECELMHLEIFHCNSEGSFESATFRMPLFGIAEPVPSDPPTPWTSFIFQFGDVFNFKNLELLLNVENSDDSRSKVDPDLFAAYNLLVDYIADKEAHDVCLSNVCKSTDGSLPTSSSETDMAYALACHLFMPLTGGSCVLDNHSRSWPRSCPGGCKGIAQKGPTGVGAVQIWHGFADILIDKKIPLMIWKEVPDVLTDEKREDTLGDSESVAADESLSRCSLYSLNVEVKRYEQPHCQLIAQTITNSFAQVNENKRLSEFLIPSFGCCNNEIVIFGYDCENDVLVKKIDPIALWTEVDDVWQLSISAIVQIWMYIHFPLMMLPSLAKSYDNNIQSNFHKCHTIKLFRKYSKCHIKGFSHERSVGLLQAQYMIPTKKMKTDW